MGAREPVSEDGAIKIGSGAAQLFALRLAPGLNVYNRFQRSRPMFAGAAQRNNLEPFDALSLLAELEDWEVQIQGEAELLQFLAILRAKEKETPPTLDLSSVSYDPADKPVPLPDRADGDLTAEPEQPVAPAVRKAREVGQ
ncbi:MAG: hypothetical protein AAGF20_08760 [Pseudomonadota bacterium]